MARLSREREDHPAQRPSVNCTLLECMEVDIVDWSSVSRGLQHVDQNEEHEDEIQRVEQDRRDLGYLLNPFVAVLASHHHHL
jgi:hypothetical protein